MSRMVLEAVQHVWDKILVKRIKENKMNGCSASITPDIASEMLVNYTDQELLPIQVYLNVLKVMFEQEEFCISRNSI